MPWIKHVLIDLAVTLLIVLGALLDLNWVRWILYVYTPLMLALKLLAVGSGSFLQQKTGSRDQPPDWFFHLLYAVSFGTLLFVGWWTLGGLWAAVWLLSAYGALRKRNGAPTRTKPGGRASLKTRPKTARA